MAIHQVRVIADLTCVMEEIEFCNEDGAPVGLNIRHSQQQCVQGTLGAHLPARIDAHNAERAGSGESDGVHELL